MEKEFFVLLSQVSPACATLIIEGFFEFPLKWEP